MLISIIVPVYNAGQYLDKCISSILNQTYHDLQVILVDDGSTDCSADICSRYADKDARIEVIHKENGGVVSARKAGVQAARGEFIGWVDADDWIEPDYFQQMAEAQRESGADIVAAGHYHDIGTDSQKVFNNIPTGVSQCSEILPKLLYSGRFFEYGLQPHFYTKLIRSGILKKTQMQADERIYAGEDAAVVYPSVLEADSICVTQICGYHYVQHQGSMTKTHNDDELDRFYILADYLEQVFRQKDPSGSLLMQLGMYKKYFLFLRSMHVFDEAVLLPYGGVPARSRVVIYGAGVLGQRMHQYLAGCGTQIVLWADRNYADYRRRGMQVDAPESIRQHAGQYDYVLIANTAESTADAIRTDLIRLGVPEGKIRWFTDEFIGGVPEEKMKADAKVIIYGAKSIALGIGEAVRKLYPQSAPLCFLVSSLQGNPSELMGLRVREIEEFVREHGRENLDSFHVLIGTPEDIHQDIVRILDRYGFCSYTCMDSRKEAALMERYFDELGIFPSVHSLPSGNRRISLQVYLAKSARDKKLSRAFQQPDWAAPIQVGAQLTDIRTAELTDYTVGSGSDAADSISSKNGNYCELTAIYWIWKNRLCSRPEDAVFREYYGLFHYRRILDISDEDLRRMKSGDIDVLLQYPTLHEPDISEHHARYMKEEDWAAMIQALRELQPEYADAFPKILSQKYFYNYNLIVAKRQVLADYCEWLFPVLERTEQLSTPKGCERSDRYIGYLGENLMTLYFLFHKHDLKICHTGRLMLI